MPAAQRGNSCSRPATVMMVCAVVDEEPSFQATNAATDRAPVAPHNWSCSISAAISTIRASMALRCPANSANSPNNTSSRSETTFPVQLGYVVDVMNPSKQPATTILGRPNGGLHTTLIEKRLVAEFPADA